MINVFDVAEYILSKLDSITTMKLQKLLYYCQAWSLVWDDEPLFDNDFEAWVNGPVCRELFDKHRHKFRVTHGDFNEFISGCDFSNRQIETMDAVLDFYGDKEPHFLIELTHKEDPWKLARGNCDDTEYCDTTISKDSMVRYYGNLS